MGGRELLGLVLCLAGCDLFPGVPSPSSPEPQVVPGDYLLYWIGAPGVGGPPETDFQQRVPLEMCHFYENDGPEPEFICQHDPLETDAKVDELDIPWDVPCVPEAANDDPASETDGATPYEGLAGANPMPEDYDSWPGAADGSCGVWSNAMCNRILGITDPTSHVTRAEFDEIAAAVGYTPGTGTTAGAQIDYYQARGWCVTFERFDGDADSYAEMAERLNADGCDVKLKFSRIVGDDFENSHVETVTSVSELSATTNSWGHVGVVRGGSDGGFSHSGEGVWFGEGESGGLNWPPDETSVYVTYVCPCQTSVMERLAATLFQD